MPICFSCKESDSPVSRHCLSCGEYFCSLCCPTKKFLSSNNGKARSLFCCPNCESSDVTIMIVLLTELSLGGPNFEQKLLEVEKQLNKTLETPSTPKKKSALQKSVEGNKPSHSSKHKSLKRNVKQT